MQLFNIGPIELILILVIMFILLGPEQMINTARTIGATVRKVIRSDMWREITGYSREIRDLPNRVMQETGLEEDFKEIKKVTEGTVDEIQKTVNEDLKVDPIVISAPLGGTPAAGASQAASSEAKTTAEADPAAKPAAE